jgi:ribonuclease P protein component
VWIARKLVPGRVGGMSGGPGEGGLLNRRDPRRGEPTGVCPHGTPPSEGLLVGISESKEALPGRCSGTRLTSTVTTQGEFVRRRTRPRPGTSPPPAQEGTKGREANLSTQRPETGEEPRLPAPHVDAGRPCHSPFAPTARPEPPVRLSGQAPGAVWRIRDRATFEALRHSGHRARQGPVTVTYATVGDAPEPRVAYAIGKRVGRAVVRNRLRRQLRAAVDDMAELRPGAYLVAVGPAATGLSYEDLRTKVVTAMTAASVGGRQ